MSICLCLFVIIAAFIAVGYFYVQKKNAIPGDPYMTSINPDYLGIDAGWLIVVG